MRKIAWKSTFADVQQLLIDQDETFIKQLEYLNSDQFQKETDRGYLRRNLHFFMAIVLQGIQSPTDKKYIENFLYIMYPNPTPIETKLGAWRQNAGNFVGKSRKLTINKALLSISKDTEMDVFRTGDWVNFKDSSGKAIFWDSNNNSIFIDGKADAIQKMKQIAEFLIDGTQITSGGGFSLMVDTYSLLKANKQLILNGAPGTGKTFSARNEIADKLLGENADKNIQMEMVQFHPSYDYTDFIEGIRPNLASESIGYTLKKRLFQVILQKGRRNRAYTGFRQKGDGRCHKRVSL